MVHERLDGTARKRFSDNKKHFIEGEDYFVRKTDEAKKEFEITAPNGLVLITESGYLMLVKSFTEYRRPIFGQRLEKWIQPGR